MAKVEKNKCRPQLKLTHSQARGKKICWKKRVLFIWSQFLWTWSRDAYAYTLSIAL